VRPTQRAVASIDPEFADAGFTDKGDIGRRSRSQSSPKMGIATLHFASGIAHTGQHLLHPFSQHIAAGFGKRTIQSSVITADFYRSGDAQLITQTADGAFGLVVNHRNLGGQLRLQNLKRAAVAFARVNR
jgi:hypothetical protein